MPWVRLGDEHYDDPRVLAISLGALGLLHVGLIWATRQLTDGWVDDSMLRSRAGRAADRYLNELDRVQLLRRDDHGTVRGWRIADDLVALQPTAEQVRRDRANAAERQRRRRESRRDRAVTSPDTGRSSRRDASVTDDDVTPLSRPSHAAPTRPDPVPDPVPDPDRDGEGDPKDRDQERDPAFDGRRRAPQSPQRTTPAADPPVLTFETVGTGDRTWPLTERQVETWQEAYPGLDVLPECRQALAWLEANPTRRKTAKGMARFLVGWLNRAQDRGGRAAPATTKSARAELAAEAAKPPCDGTKCGGNRVKHQQLCHEGTRARTADDDAGQARRVG